MGTIPDNLFKADVLNLRNNKFSGMLLKTVGKRSGLAILPLRNNSFQTHIPETICKLIKIGLLNLSHNKFKGVIPSCLGNMSFGVEGYEIDDLSTDQLYAFEPLVDFIYTSAFDFDVVYSGDYSQTARTTIVDNVIKRRDEAYQGEILDSMYGLDLSSNELSGDIPVDIGDLEYIISLNFSNNHLTGSILESFSKLKDLESLDLSYNMLDGKIPPQLADLNSLRFFSVSFNNLSGEIPFKGQLGTFEERSYIGNVNLCGLPTNKSCMPTGVSEPSSSNQVEEEEEESNDMVDIVWF